MSITRTQEQISRFRPLEQVHSSTEPAERTSIFMENRKEELKKSIARMLECADERKLSLIYIHTKALLGNNLRELDKVPGKL